MNVIFVMLFNVNLITHSNRICFFVVFGYHKCVSHDWNFLQYVKPTLVNNHSSYPVYFYNYLVHCLIHNGLKCLIFF